MILSLLFFVIKRPRHHTASVAAPADEAVALVRAADTAQKQRRERGFFPFLPVFVILIHIVHLF